MIIKYEFNTLDENFDNTELEAVKQAEAMARALNRICEELRSWTKYGAFPKKQKTKEEDIIFEGTREYVEDVNKFIGKYPDVIADVWEMRDEIINIINESGVDLERLGY